METKHLSAKTTAIQKVKERFETWREVRKKRTKIPLDNNLCEQALKRTILHRKNALFYKTQHGAYIGDLFMSIIHTCILSGVNPFEYLTALEKHSSKVFKDPKKWLPWNYEQH